MNDTAQGGSDAVFSIVPASNLTEGEKPPEILKAEEALENSAKLMEPITEIAAVAEGNELEVGIIVARSVNTIKKDPDIKEPAKKMLVSNLIAPIKALIKPEDNMKIFVLLSLSNLVSDGGLNTALSHGLNDLFDKARSSGRVHDHRDAIHSLHLALLTSVSSDSLQDSALIGVLKGFLQNDVIENVYDSETIVDIAKFFFDNGAPKMGLYVINQASQKQELVKKIFDNLNPVELEQIRGFIRDEGLLVHYYTAKSLHGRLSIEDIVWIKQHISSFDPDVLFERLVKTGQVAMFSDLLEPGESADIDSQRMAIKHYFLKEDYTSLKKIISNMSEGQVNLFTKDLVDLAIKEGSMSQKDRPMLNFIFNIVLEGDISIKNSLYAIRKLYPLTRFLDEKARDELNRTIIDLVKEMQGDVMKGPSFLYGYLFKLYQDLPASFVSSNLEAEFYELCNSIHKAPVITMQERYPLLLATKYVDFGMLKIAESKYYDIKKDFQAKDYHGPDYLTDLAYVAYAVEDKDFFTEVVASNRSVITSLFDGVLSGKYKDPTIIFNKDFPLSDFVDPDVLMNKILKYKREDLLSLLLQNDKCADAINFAETMAILYGGKTKMILNGFIPQRISEFSQFYFFQLLSPKTQSPFNSKDQLLLLKYYGGYENMPDEVLANLDLVGFVPAKFSRPKAVLNKLSIDSKLLWKKRLKGVLSDDILDVIDDIDDFPDFVKRWKMSFTKNSFGAILTNLRVIKKLEVERPGLVNVLYKEFGITDFARHPLEYLVKQYDERNSDLEYVVVSSAAYDSNGILYTEGPILSRFFDKLSTHGYAVRVIEASDKFGVLRRHIKLGEKYRKISGLIINSHGSEDGIRYGKGKAVATIEDFKSGRLDDFYKEKAPVGSLSCSSESLMVAASNTHKGIMTGSSEPVRISFVYPVIDEDGELFAFDIGYEKDGEESDPMYAGGGKVLNHKSVKSILPA